MVTKKKDSKVTPIKSIKPRQKKVTLKSVEKQFNDYNKLSTYVVSEDDNSVIKYYAKFSQDRIEDVLRDAHNALSYAEENNLDFFKNDMEFLQYIHLLIIKNFSHFKDEISDEFETQIAQFNQLIAIGYFELFFSEIFDPSEVQKVIDKVESFEKLIAQIDQLDEETREELMNKVQSPVVKKKMKQNAKV